MTTRTQTGIVVFDRAFALPGIGEQQIIQIDADDLEAALTKDKT